MTTQTTHQSKAKLLNAALTVIRAKGYAATTVEDICRAATVTKGSFFHHFKSKDDLALSAVAWWGELTEAFFASAPYHQPPRQTPPPRPRPRRSQQRTTGPSTQAICRILDQWSLFGRDWSMVNRTGPGRPVGPTTPWSRWHSHTHQPPR